MKYLFQLTTGYLFAAPLTDKVQLNMMDTDWGNLLTYLWIMFGNTIFAIIVLAVVIIGEVLGRRLK